MSTKQKPLVYSYTRFSSAEQAEGDSERRQLEAAQKFAQKIGGKLDTGLRMIDRGLSGYHAQHKKKGAFGEFLKKVEAGEVPRGSILLVENMDRLSREPAMTALDTVNKLLNRGVTIQTLSPEFTYTLESVNHGNGIWPLITYITMSNAESAKKADRLRAAWQEKRKTANEKIVTSRAPAWLRVKEVKFETIPEAADTIRLIFKLKLEGFGKNTIAAKLNKEAGWKPEKGWFGSYVEKILRSRAVIGEFQPHRLDEHGKRVPDGEAIANYFPAVIAPETFHLVQSRMAGNRGTGGQTGKANNIFQNLVRCGYCGAPMIFLDKGQPPKGGQYLVCDNAWRKVGCSPHHVRYDEFQETILNNLSKLRPETVLPNQDEQAEQSKHLRDAIAGLAGQLTDIEARVTNLVDQIERTANAELRQRYEQRVEALEADKVKFEAERASKEAILKELGRGEQSFDKWQKGLTGLKEAVAKDADSRIRLKAHLKELVSKIDVFGHGHEDTVEHAEAIVEEYIPELAKAPTFKSFRKYLRHRLLSTDGRFYQMHLKSVIKPGVGIQVAPVGSLAWKTNIKGNDWKFNGPPVDALMSEFFDGRKPGFVPKASRC
jgi:DNA invertase Pin-like site-specific DNA recombinase